MKEFKKWAAAALAFGSLAFAAPAAQAADLAVAEPAPVIAPSIFDVAFGVKLTNDYILRSVSQTSGHAAVQGYAEVTALDWFYAGVWGSNVDFGGPQSLELDWYAGIRHTFDRLTLDVGYLDINYPGAGRAGDIDFWKIYGIARYALTEDVTVGANIYWTSEFIGVKGIDGTHASAFGRIALPGLSPLPEVTPYISAEIGKQWFAKNFAPEYVFWNIGGGVTYKAMSIDLRYTGADLSRRECGLFIGQRGSCGDRFMASLSFDTSLSKLK